MATISSAIYADVARMATLAEKANEDNYDGGADLGEQAIRLAEIADLAGRASKLAAAVDKALS